MYSTQYGKPPQIRGGFPYKFLQVFENQILDYGVMEDSLLVEVNKRQSV